MNEHRRQLLGRAVLLLHELSGVSTPRTARSTHPALVQHAAVDVVSRLVATGDARPRDLRPSLHLTSGGLSNLLGRLEQAGLVTRRAASDDDLRGVVVSITPEGRQLERTMAAARTDAIRAADQLVKELIVVLVDAGAVPGATDLPDAPTIETQVSISLTELTMILRETLSRDDVSDAAANAALTLAALDQQGPCRPRYLADLLQLTSGGTSRLIDRLEHRGLLERDRQAVESDQRGVVVSITPAGVAQLEQTLEQVAGRLDDLLGLLRALRVQVQGLAA